MNSLFYTCVRNAHMKIETCDDDEECYSFSWHLENKYHIDQRVKNIVLMKIKEIQGIKLRKTSEKYYSTSTKKIVYFGC